jgi:hypothetical protein
VEYALRKCVKTKHSAAVRDLGIRSTAIASTRRDVKKAAPKGGFFMKIYTAEEAASSVTMLITKSARSAAARGLAAGDAPSATRRSIAAPYGSRR